MTSSPQLQRSLEEASARVAAMPPEEYVECAALLREVMPRLKDDSARETAQRLITDLEGRAAGKAAAQSA